MIGWGTTDEGGAQSSVLLEVELIVMDDQTCSQAMAGGRRWNNLSSIGQVLTEINILCRFFQMNKFVQEVKREKILVRLFSIFVILITDTIGYREILAAH